MRASDANIWTVCHGSAILAKMMQDIPGGNSAIRDEGVLAHKCAEDALCGGDVLNSSEYPDKAMATWAIEYASYVKDFCRKYIIEDVIPKGIVHPALSKGRVDAWGVDRLGMLHIFDFKFGFNFVAAKDNPQMVLYAGGLIRRDRLEVTGVTLHIYQPRIGNIDSHSYSPDDFESALNKVMDEVTSCMGDNPRFVVGSHCKYCKPRFACKTFMNACLDDTEISSDFVMPEDVTLDQASVYLDIFKRSSEHLKGVITGLEAFVIFRLKSGEYSRIWEIREGLSNRIWKENVERLEQLGLCKVTPITPSEADRLLGKEVVNKLTYRAPKGAKLKRSKENATDVFGGKK